MTITELARNDTHKELIPNNVGMFVEKDVPNGYHYELQYLNGLWQWVLVKDNKNETKTTS